MWRYLKAALLAGTHLPGLGFLPIHLMLLAGVAAAGLINPGFWFAGLALETAFLSLVLANPRFRKAIDAQARVAPSDDAAARRLALIAGLPADERTRYESVVDTCRRIVTVRTSVAAERIDLDLPGEALARLQWASLKLLVARSQLRQRSGDSEAELQAKAEVLARELAAPDLSPAVLESKRATADLLARRIEALHQRQQMLAEIEADLARLDAQLALALDQSALIERPAALDLQMDLAGRLLDSGIYGSAEADIAALDRSFARVPQAQ